MSFEQLVSHIQGKSVGYRGVVVALSGGVDSGLVAAAAHQAVAAVAVTVRSALTPARDAEQATAVAFHIGIGHAVMDIDILDDPQVRGNLSDRCYHCKKKIFRTIVESHGSDILLLDGTNADDDPARPGLRAVREFGVFSPLLEVGLIKDVVREISKDIKLPNWNAPSESCLATRFPVGEGLTRKALGQVESMESFFHDLGVKTVRVRPDNLVAIVEHHPQYSEIIKNNTDNFMAHVQSIGLRSCRFKERSNER